MNIKIIKENIEVLRKKLNILVETKGHLTSVEVVELSQRLDKYISDYFMYNKRNKYTNALH